MFSVLLPDPQVGKSFVGPGNFATVQELLWFNCSPILWFYSVANANLLQEDICHTPCLPGLLQPEALSTRQVTTDPCHHRGHSDSQRQTWLSLLWIVTAPFPLSWYTPGFVYTFRVSLVGLKFYFKCDCIPPTILLGLLLCPWM